MKKNLHKKLLIVDDDPVLQAFLLDFFKQNNFEVFNLLCGEDIEAFLEQQTIDLILLDILLPEKDGYYWLQWIRDNYAKLPVLLLSVKGDPADRAHGIEMGANDYLSKPADPRELLARVNNIFSYTSNSSAETEKVHFGDFVFEIKNGLLSHKGTPIRLTTTEGNLLKIFCENPNQTLSRDKMTLSLRGNEHNPYDRSIDVHINRLRNKIEDVPAKPKFLLTTWGKGYRFIIDS